MVEKIDIDDIPLCPLCDQPIMVFEPCSVTETEGCKFLAHAVCLIVEHQSEINEIDVE